MLTNAYRIQGRVFWLATRDAVMTPSAYSLFFANNIPALSGQQVADVGSGTGIQGLVALAHGARHVFFIDNNPLALDLCAENARRNGFNQCDYTLVEGHGLYGLPARAKLDTLLSNPASLPMPSPAGPTADAYFAGPDGRAMIEDILRNLAAVVALDGQLLLVHTSLANLAKTYRLAEELNLQISTIANRRVPFRPFYDRTHIDHLGGIKLGLYILEGQESYEILHLLRIAPA